MQEQYSPKLAELAYEIAAKGKTNLEIAESLHINIKTLYKWQNDHPEFKRSIRDGKDLFDSEQVEKALLEDALGHHAEEVVLERDPETGKFLEVKRTKKWERNFQAQRLWLLNRSDRWKDKQEIEISARALEDRLASAEKRLQELRNGKGSATGDTGRDQVEKEVGEQGRAASVSRPGDPE